MDVATADHASAGTAAPTGPRRRVAAACLLVGLVLAVFGQAIGFGWVNLDDEIHVTGNPHLNPVTLAGLARLWTGPYQNLYVPLAYTLFAGETQASRFMFGSDATAPPDARLFHAVSVLLHTVNVLLVWRLLERLAAGAIWPATAGAALFAVHPLQVESVGWISEQRGLLAATCAVSAMVLHLGCERWDGGSRRWWSCRTWALVLFGLALLAKPQMATVPLLLVILDAGVRGRPAGTAAAELVPWFVLGGLVSLVTRLLQPNVYTEHVALWLRPIVAGDALLFYASTLVCPVHLSVDYGRTPQVVLQSPAACAAAVTAWLVVAAILGARRLGRWRVSVAVSIAALLPVLGFTPFLFQDYSTVADRYFYLAMLGPAVAVTWASAGFVESRRRQAAVAAVTATLLLLAGGSFVQTRVWRNSFTLCEHAIRVDPHTFLGNCNLGAALIDAGRPGEAVEFLHRAVKVNPDHVDAHYSLAIALDQVNRPDEAALFYGNVLTLYPKHAKAHNFLGVIHARQGRVAKAAEHFRAAVGHDPGYQDAQTNLERATKLLEASPAGR